jgi:alpha-1,2-glucosyltransferase
MTGMTTIVYYNTLVHPFTLADNRHYTFYVFRILLRHPAIKYLAVPIYFLCAWAAIAALGGPQNAAASTSPSESRKGKSGVDIAQSSSQPTASGNRASFLLVWLLATTASLITTPLVEPRYFIVPWLMWRLHIAPLRKDTTAPRRESDRPYEYRLWLETGWFLLINAVTGYIFLTWGFEWPQEPGKVQRFMW